MSEPEPRDVEQLLSRALAPVEPPPGLATRLEGRLQSLSDLAAEELDGWELRAMGDPRNWVRPAAALAVGAVAGTGLVILRMRHHRRHKPAPAAALAQRTLAEAKRLRPKR